MSFLFFQKAFAQVLVKNKRSTCYLCDCNAPNNSHVISMMQGEHNAVDMIAYILVIIGGLNWGLVGFFEYDLVANLFQGAPNVARVIYALVGIAALYKLLFMCQSCKAGGKKR